jgi:hypothetical protein
MSPDFTPVLTYAVPMDRFIAEWRPRVDDLAGLTNASIDGFLALLAGCGDADVTVVPRDPAARDDAAADPADRDLAWTIAHNIVHATASGEEYAAVAAELARGIEFHGRPRHETPWQRVTTVAQCRQRLEESRRMRLASLQLWPDLPDLDKGYTPWKASGWVDALGIFAWGLVHDRGHRTQIAGIQEQARARWTRGPEFATSGQMF